MQRFFLASLLFFLPLWAYPGALPDSVAGERQYFDISQRDAIEMGIMDESANFGGPLPAHLIKRDVVTLDGNAAATCPLLHDVSTTFTVGAEVVGETFKILRGKT